MDSHVLKPSDREGPFPLFWIVTLVLNEIGKGNYRSWQQRDLPLAQSLATHTADLRAVYECVPCN